MIEKKHENVLKKVKNEFVCLDVKFGAFFDWS